MFKKQTYLTLIKRELELEKSLEETEKIITETQSRVLNLALKSQKSIKTSAEDKKEMKEGYKIIYDATVKRENLKNSLARVKSKTKSGDFSHMFRALQKEFGYSDIEFANLLNSNLDAIDRAKRLGKVTQDFLDAFCELFQITIPNKSNYIIVPK